MNSPISLVRHPPNTRLIEALKALLAEAEAGDIVGLAGVKLRADNRFGTLRVGACSDLELAGALAFASHDLITGNPGAPR